MKRILITLMTAVLAFSAPVSIYAAENVEVEETEDETDEDTELVSETEKREETGSGDTVSSCNITVELTDETGSYAGGEITMNLTDVSGTITDSIVFEEIGTAVTKKIIAPTTYNATFSGLSEGYHIINEDGSKDITFAATSNGNVNLKLIITDQDIVVSDEIVDGDNGIEVEEGDMIFMNFITKTASMRESGSDWENTVLNLYKLYESSYGEKYVKYVEGATIEEWDEMSLYERFVWMESYVRFKDCLNRGEYSYFYDSLEDFKNNVIYYVYTLIQMTDSEDMQEVYDAYMELAEWQYDYIIENNEPYDFITGKTYLQEMKEEAESEKEEIVEEEKEYGKWISVLVVLKNNIVTIIVLGVLAAIFAYMRLRNRKYNIDDEDSNRRFVR